MRRRSRSALLSLGVAIALADSSIVTLALPDLVRRYDVGITDVAWVLTSYNLVLAAAAVPSAYLARRRPRLLCAAALIVFAGSALVCGLAPSFEVLVAARCIQALGAAPVIATALTLLAEVEGSVERAAHLWARAGILGAAFGPAVGGVLTQALGWEAIFLAQAPVALLPLAVLPSLRARRSVDPSVGHRPHIGANLALLLGSAALSAALFLLVILLVNGWGIDPAAAGAVVTVIPVAAIAAGRIGSRVGGPVMRAAAGLVLIAGGLGALGRLPHAGWAWTVAPQLLVGAGLGLTVAALTERALLGHAAQGVHGAWTIASRHAGVVVGLLVLTPLFTASLGDARRDAKQAGAAIVLDSEIPPLEKIGVARDVLRVIEDADGRLPDVRVVFADRGEAADAPELARVAGELQERLEWAVTSAFGPPFLLAAALALAALAALGVTKDVEP